MVFVMDIPVHSFAGNFYLQFQNEIHSGLQRINGVNFYSSIRSKMLSVLFILCILGVGMVHSENHALNKDLLKERYKSMQRL